MDWGVIVLDSQQAVWALLIGVALIFIISGVDDLFIDAVYFLRALYRRLYILPRYPALTEADLNRRPEQPIAIMIPAWDESAVIQVMLRNMVQKLQYSKYHIFVGTYPNDTATIREVEMVRADHPQIHRISTPHPGPTNKADCLNWIYQGIRAYEDDSGIAFEIIVMQDCEDVLHPLCYKLINYLIPKFDMVQLPVLSFRREWWQFTGGHYLDEFAQLHYKDLVVREFLDQSIPAAGVGCAFSRKALRVAAADQNNALFNTSSLTEDYDFGLRLKVLSLRQAFAKFFVEREVLRRNPLTGGERLCKVRELVCVREFFPHTFHSAVRQKSRWVLGISLQGWHHLGWQGGPWRRYMLWRDRKVLVTNAVNIIGYALVLLVLGGWAIDRWMPLERQIGLNVESTRWISVLLLLNLGLLGLRLSQRAYCVWSLYGWAEALWSVPRTFWGNVINFCATARALRLFVRSRLTGKAVAWDKTHHYFPSAEQLRHARPMLGDVLLARCWVTVDDLKQALNRQRQDPRQLGSILQDMGLLSEDQLNTALQSQG
jgi:bacteriophage N4 adsorption protein B